MPLFFWSDFFLEALVFSKILQILGLQPPVSKVFLDHKNNCFLTVGQNNFGNKILMFIYLLMHYKIVQTYFHITWNMKWFRSQFISLLSGSIYLTWYFHEKRIPMFHECFEPLEQIFTCFTSLFCLFVICEFGILF